MFKAVIVVSESRTSVVWRIDVDAFHLAGELLFKRLEGEKVVAVDEHVVEDVLTVAATGCGVVRFRRILHQHARLQPRPLLLADPG